MKEKVSKRILGFFSFLLGLVMAFISGLDFYVVESAVIFAVFGYSAVLLGLDAYKRIPGTTDE